MASDVLHFLRKHSISNVSLIGHSMWVNSSLIQHAGRLR
jgi:hypothetical protein